MTLIKLTSLLNFYGWSFSLVMGLSLLLSCLTLVYLMRHKIMQGLEEGASALGALLLTLPFMTLLWGTAFVQMSQVGALREKENYKVGSCYQSKDNLHFMVVRNYPDRFLTYVQEQKSVIDNFTLGQEKFLVPCSRDLAMVAKRYTGAQRNLAGK